MAAIWSGRIRSMPAQESGPPKNFRRMVWALMPVTRRVRGSFSRSRVSRSLRVRALVMQWISVPPEFRFTHAMSGRRASASATGRAASGAHCTRSQDSKSPTRLPSGSPTTRIRPVVRRRR